MRPRYKGDDRAPAASAVGLCDGIIEACWLSAVVAAPIVFDPQALSGFQPIKSYLIRFFAALVACAWALRSLVRRSGRPEEQGPSRSRVPQRLFISVALFCATVASATFFSVYPAQSFWGSYELRQGALTAGCYIIFFFAVAGLLRREDQARRFVTALILPTLPLSLHAVLQRLGFDPLPFHGEGGGRVFGLAGNPIFLAAYLGSVFPFTLWRAIGLSGQDSPARGQPLLRQATYGAVAVLQLIAILFAESRGPIVGLLASITFLALCLAAPMARNRLLKSLSVVVFLALAVLALAMGSQTRSKIAALPVFRRFSVDAGANGSPEDARAALWRQASQLHANSGPFLFPNGEHDRWNAIREFVGYGPETLQCVLPQKFSFAGVDAHIESRFHNWVWDQWYSIGGLGLVAFAAIAAFAFESGYRKIGMIRSPKDEAAYWSIVVLLTLALAGGFSAWRGPSFLGLGLSAGFTLGLALYPALWGLQKFQSDEQCSDNCRSSLIVPVMASIVFHLTETSFAFPVAATALVYWMGLGIASCGRERNSPPGDVPQTRTVRLFEDSAALAEFGESAAPVAMVALVLCFSFIYLNSLEPASISRVLSASLLRIRSDGGPSHLFAIVLIPTWMGASFLCSLESANLARVWSVLLRSALIAAVSGAIGVVYALVKSAQIVAASPIPSTAVDPLTAVHLESAYLSATSGFAWASLFVLAAWAWCLRGPADNAWVFATRMNVGISLGILTAAGATAWFGCVIPSYANSLAGWANIMVAAGNQAGGIHAYSRALSLDPRATAYRIPLAKLLADRAESKTVRELRETGMAAAEALLVEGGTISSLDRDTYYLGDFYLRWAGDEESRYERRAHAMAARRELEKSVRFEPGFEPAHVGLALADQMFLNDPKGAESEMKRADGLISPATAAASFEFYRKTSLESRSPELKGFRARRAFWCCATAVDYARSKSLPEFPLHLRCGILHEMVGDTAGAILELKMAASLTDRDTWVAESYLSQCYHLQGNSVAAIEHINRALDSAPPEARDNLEKLRQQYAALQ